MAILSVSETLNDVREFCTSQSLWVARLILFCLLAYLLNVTWYAPILCFAILGPTCVLVHYLGHDARTPLWSTIHTDGHHIKFYSTNDFYSDDYRVNDLDLWGFGSLVYVVPSLLLAYKLNDVLGSSMALFSLLAFQALFELSHEEYMHRLIHTKRTRLRRFKWFQYLVKKHYRHHCGKMNCNFGISILIFDLLFGTLSK